MRRRDGKDSHGWLMGTKLGMGPSAELLHLGTLSRLPGYIVLATEGMAFQAGPMSRHNTRGWSEHYPNEEF